MKSALSHVICIACVCIPSAAFAYGEDGSIPYGARAIHLLINEARTNPHEALANCGSNCPEDITTCFKDALQPLYLHDGLTKSAQFYSDLMAYSGCLQSLTPCKLVSSIASDYPDTCDGNPTCACTNHEASCTSTDGTSPGERIEMFSTDHGKLAENYAYYSITTNDTPLRLFNVLLLTKGTKNECVADSSNGTRFRILSEDYHAIGIGYSNKHNPKIYSVHDFGSQFPGEKNALSSGSHYFNKTLYFKTHYYADTEVKKVAIAINGTCIDLPRTRGTAKNGIFGTSDISMPAKCTPYFYEAIDTKGKIVRFPTTGSLLFSLDSEGLSCDQSWQKTTEIASCLDTSKCTEEQHIYDGMCETDTAENCGTHGTSCILEHVSSATCTKGECHIDECETGFHVYEKTCEADDINNCGAHGTVCGAEGASEVGCQDGQCTIIACEEGKQLENNQCVEAGSPDTPTPPEDPDNPTPEDPDNPTPEDPDNPTPEDPDNPTPEDPDNPDNKPTTDPDENPGDTTPADAEQSSKSSSGNDCSAAPITNSHTSPLWFLLGLFGLGIARRRKEN